ncbi:MAG: CBS domain-containing protein [Candidatus Omnitrophota bacterium]
MKVREIMKEKVVSIKPQDNALEALRQLFKMKISGLPVVDEQGKLQGMFTEKEILSYVLPSYIEKVGSFVYEENPKATRKKFSELSAITVSQLMRKEVITVGEETTLSEAARIMLTKKARRLPVIDKSGRVVGIVARCDVVESLAKEAG